jgi:hypothetical protein
MLHFLSLANLTSRQKWLIRQSPHLPGKPDKLPEVAGLATPGCPHQTVENDCQPYPYIYQVPRLFPVRRSDPAISALARDTVSFSIVRHPFERLVSAYQDKVGSYSEGSSVRNMALGIHSFNFFCTYEYDGADLF